MIERRRDPTRQRLRLSSLRTRYLLVTAVVALFVFFSVWLTQSFISQKRSARSENISIRNQLTAQGRELRDSLRTIEDRLERFMWSPTAENRQGVHAAIEQALGQQQRLFAHPWLERSGILERIRPMGKELAALHGQLDQAMDRRLDKDQQFPAMGLIHERGNPAHLEFSTALQSALAESTDEQATTRRLTDTRSYWLQMVAEFRMYMANRIASANPERLGEQEHNIELLYSEVETQLSKLESLNSRGALNLAASEALAQMQSAAHRWQAVYQEIKRLHHSNNWRTDAPFLKGTVEPQFQQLWGRLRLLEQALEVFADNEVHALTRAANTVIYTLWLLAFIGLAFILLGMFVFERSVLNPISMVARALRAEAHGETDIELPHTTSLETLHLVDAFSEMRRQVQERQHALEHQALHDALTGLPNRVLLHDRLEQAIRRSQHNRVPLALFILDLDGFKEINDTLGHQVGDHLLQGFGERIQALLEDTDTLVRLGGDEFGILLPEADEDKARRTAGQILKSLEEPFVLDTQSLYVGCSIGIALCPQHADEASELNRLADVAMYVAKREKSGMAIYNLRQDHHSLQRLALVNELREAVATEALRLHYQPLLRVSDRHIFGVEVLLRWPHPERGLIPPEEFIPLAEKTGLMRSLTYWVLDRALEQSAIWRRQGLALETISINLSVYNLQDRDLCREVAKLLQKWDLPPKSLMLELTESAMMADPVQALETLTELNAIGIQLAVDDFGTGFSSLAYLKQLPVDKIKIDKSFVTEMDSNENDAVIVRSTIDLAHNLGLEVVAEGVETEEVMELLTILECDAAQGFLLGRPLPPEKLPNWWRHQREKAGSSPVLIRSRN